MYKAKLLAKIRCLKIVPGFLLLVAVLVASANLWLNDADLTKLLVAVAVVLINLVFMYLDYACSSYEGVGACVTHLWWGFLLGSLTYGAHYYRVWAYDDRDRLVDMLIMTSTAIKCCCDFLDRFLEVVHHRSMFLLPVEVTALFGALIGGIIFLGPQADCDLLIITVASALVVANLRMKCTLAFLTLFLFIAISGIAVFDNMPIVLNPYSLICYHIRLFFPPATDFYFSPLSAMERWSWSFGISRLKHLCLTIVVFIVEALFCALAFFVILLHPEYELVFVVPVVSVSGLLWLCTHLAYLSTELTLASKLSECQDFYHKLPTTSGGTGLSHIMSSKGVRNLCLVGQQIVACALLTTLFFGGISWRRENATYPALLLVVIGIECASFGRIRELAVKLGGTCVAYALITTTTVVNPNAKITILPADSLQKQNDRATSLITAIHKFFALYLIDNIGCDYSTSGLSLNAVEEKLRNLFNTKTKEGDGVRCDTYIFYYSGLTAEDGSCVLADGAVLSPDHVIELWRDSCCDDNAMAPSRLLLIMDVATPDPWVKMVASLRREYVAIQTCKLASVNSSKRDVESGGMDILIQPGSFTPEWVQWNYDITSKSGLSPNSWFDDDVATSLRPTYNVSRRWTDFALRVPTSNNNEMSGHWKSHYPFCCRPFLTLSASCARRLNLVRMLSAPGRRYRRFKMRWFPPTVLDTGHGFKLVRA
ncbi:transmembrane protein 168-like isoform X2 [Clavelina lepadiformis]